MNTRHCIVNSIGQYFSEDGIWVDDLRVYCCFTYEQAKEFMDIYDLYNDAKIKLVSDETN